MLTSIWSRLRWEERRNENAVISKTRYKLIVLCSEDTDVYLIPLKLEKWHQKWEICFHAVFNELAVWFCIVRTSEGDNALIFPVWSRPARIYWQHSFIFSQVEVCVCVCVRRHKSDLSGSALTRKKRGVFRKWNQWSENSPCPSGEFRRERGWARSRRSVLCWHKGGQTKHQCVIPRCGAL